MVYEEEVELLQSLTWKIDDLENDLKLNYSKIEEEVVRFHMEELKVLNAQLDEIKDKINVRYSRLIQSKELSRIFRVIGPIPNYFRNISS